MLHLVIVCNEQEIHACIVRGSDDVKMPSVRLDYSPSVSDKDKNVCVATIDGTYEHLVLSLHHPDVNMQPYFAMCSGAGWHQKKK